MKSILGIDIGSSKTVALIADYQGDDLTVTGIGISKSSGIKKGAITNIDQAAKSIKQAVNDAKRIAGTTVNLAIVSLSSTYTKSIKSHGIVNIPTNEITIKEINRAVQTALYNANIQNDSTILQAIPYNFKVDEMSEIDDPAGMSGSRLEVSMHIITAHKSGLDNIKKTLKIAGIDIANIVVSSYASAIATLNDDEKELGVAVIDIGATTSDLAIFSNASFMHSDFIGVGSHHITNDLSMALHTPIVDAEAIKINFASISHEEVIEITTIGDEENKQQASTEIISQVMSARINETLMLLNKMIEESGLKNKIGAGIILTGGFTKLDNLRDIAIPIFGNMPVRIAKPKEVDGLFDNLKSEEFSTVVGLIIYALGKHANYEIDSNKKFRSKYSEPDSNIDIDENISPIEQEERPNEKEELLNIDEKSNTTTPMQKLASWMKNLF